MPPFLFLGRNNTDGLTVQHNRDWPLFTNFYT
jgi:hypothetical protein